MAKSKWLGQLALVSLFLCGAGLFGGGAAEVSEVTRKSDGLFVVTDGKAEPMIEELTLPNDIKVMTNGFFTVKGGKERELQVGQRLGADGMLISPDGRVEPVQDHITIRDGKVVVVKDGEGQPVEEPMTFPDGNRLFPDGTFYGKLGRMHRLIDGELFTLSGSVIPTKDTILLKDGKVVVQKDGAQFRVEPGRSMMMNDGTKILGDGSIVKPDGSTDKLIEGQIVVIQGVEKRR